jgi:uncharacterized protein (DUF1330 family)
MACFLIAQINIHNHEEYKKYLDGYDEVLHRFDGEVMAVDDDVTLLEGKWPFRRTMVIEFPDEVEARRWYESEEYRKLMKHRRRASHANIILVDARK